MLRSACSPSKDPEDGRFIRDVTGSLRTVSGFACWAPGASGDIERDGLGDANAVDAGREDPSSVAGPFTRGKSPGVFRLCRLRSRPMRMAEEVRVSTRP
jgi:hypothetical protein